MSESKKEMKKLASTATREYEYAEYMNKILHKYLANKMSFDHPDQELTDNLKKEIEKLCSLIVSKENRLKSLYITLIAEKTWLEEHKESFNTSRSEFNRIFVFGQIVKDRYTSIRNEFHLSYRLYKSLERHPIGSGTATHKSIIYYINKIKKRFNGKNNPVDIMIFDTIKYTPFLGYGTYLARKDIDIWSYIKEILHDIRIMPDDEFLINHNKDSDIYEEKTHILFYPVIEYVYNNKKLNHVKNREAYLGTDAEKKHKSEEERAAKEKERISRICERELKKAIDVHNRWYLTGGEHGYLPRGYSKFIEKRENLDENKFAIIGVEKHKTYYRHGYISNGNKITGDVSNIILYDTAKKAADEIKKLKDEGVILDGTAVMI